ncbi:hypothetical protein [Mycoplasmopsis felifaucium]|uniref:Uncharacterized protein n=1 Tax=Mycoplasmopsis felifaucium TaxID=35768 RepID=A0ABZ2RSU6_9BACT
MLHLTEINKTKEIDYLISYVCNKDNLYKLFVNDPKNKQENNYGRFVYEYQSNFSRLKYLLSHIDLMLKVKYFNELFDSAISQLQVSNINHETIRQHADLAHIPTKRYELGDFISENDWSRIKLQYRLRIDSYIKFYGFCKDFINGALDGSGLADSGGALKDSSIEPIGIVIGQVSELLGLVLQIIKKETNWKEIEIDQISHTVFLYSQISLKSKYEIQELYDKTNEISQKVENIDFGYYYLSGEIARGQIKSFRNVVLKILNKAVNEKNKFDNSLIIRANNGTWY